MNLIEAMMDDFAVLTRTKSADGEGGYTAGNWTAGTTFRAAATVNSSVQGTAGESKRVDSTYTITTRRPAFLKYHDVIKCLSSGMILRITSDAFENQSPNFGTLDIAQCTAERWVLPG